MPLGNLAIVLHAHLPFVRHPEHARHLEERWYYEALIECYLPLLDVFDRLHEEGVPFALTMSITPPLAYGAHKSKLIATLHKEPTPRWAKLSPTVQLTLTMWADANAPYHDRFVNKRAETKVGLNRVLVPSGKKLENANKVITIAFQKKDNSKPGLDTLNAFFKAYGKFSIDSGNFSLFAEAAAKDGDYKGYLKPLIKDLKVLGASNKDEKPITKLWEAVIGAVAYVFTNHKKDQLGTKVPFEGSFGKTRTNIVYAIFQVVRNAFVEALTPSLDNEINIGTVGKNKDDKPGFKLLHKTEGKDKTAAEKGKDKEKKMGPLKRRKYEKEQQKKLK